MLDPLPMRARQRRAPARRPARLLLALSLLCVAATLAFVSPRPAAARSGAQRSAAPLSAAPLSAAPVSAAPVSAAPVSGAPPSGALNADRQMPGAAAAAAHRSAAGEPGAKPYPSYTPYARLGAVLKDIARRSPRVSVREIGRSAGGHPLWLVTIQKAWASAEARARWLRFVDLQLRDPDAAAAMLRHGGDLRLPMFVVCSIHGDETPGVDAGLLLIKRLAFADDAVTRRILENTVIFVSACQNPDGRIADQRDNANGFDLNRDWLTQSQPETQAVARLLVKWHPAELLDLHGFHDPMTIDPTTPPHDPNYEWDLAIKWVLPQAKAMRAAIETATPVKVSIPYLDWQYGFEDYSPYYTAQFAMYYGLVGQTAETSSRTQVGVDADYYGTLEAADFAAGHRTAMLRDQLARYIRAEHGESQPASMDVLKPLTYPFAYVIPVAGDLQVDPVQARHAVRHLLQSGIRVARARAAFSAGGTTYPAGSYIVSLRQPLRGLANVMLWHGQDVSGQAPKMYDCCAWQLPECWGFTRYEIDAPFAAEQARVDSAPDPAGRLVGGGPMFALAPATNAAVQAVDHLVRAGVRVERVVRAAGDLPLGTFLVTAPGPGTLATLAQTARDYGVDFTTVGGTDGLKTQPAYRTSPDGGVAGPLKVAVLSDGPTCFALRALGLDATVVDAAASLAGYDALVVDDATGLDRDSVSAWVRQGGRCVAVGPSGIVPGLLDLTARGGADREFYWANNVIAQTRFDPESLVTAGYGRTGYTFAFPPTWFTDLGPGVSADATYADDYFTAGFWLRNDLTGLTTSDAAGKAVIVHGDVGLGRVTFFGPLPAFRAGTEGTYRLLANAVFTGPVSPVAQDGAAAYRSHRSMPVAAR